MIATRRDQAQKSLLVQVNSAKSYTELYHYCEQFGKIESAFHYALNGDLHFILLEYNNYEEFKESFRNSVFNNQKPGIPVISPFQWFRTHNPKMSRTIDNSKEVSVNLSQQDTKVITDSSLNEVLASAESINDQIIILHRMTQLNELGIRLRYLAGRQLEMALNGMFPNVKTHLFGSSVNGFGKIGCDLDLILRLNDNPAEVANSRLVFHTKLSLSNERSQVQRQMEVVGDIMHVFLPAINHVRKILNARVPIIKYNHECLDLEVDFSMSNMTGFYMSELLYIYGEIDDRVRPLAFCIRKWASSIGLTNSASPGRWISNFSLTVLVLFFLQNLENPILPPLKKLIKSATTNDIRVTDDNINCTFLRDLKALEFQSKNKDSLQLLLLQFFEFYSKFNFQAKGISMIEGRSIAKPDHSAIWITNPLEPLLNVSKNVSQEELEKLKFESKNAAWILEATIDDTQHAESWGLLNLFKTNKKQVRPEMFFKSRLVDVTDLFTEEEDKRKYDRIQYKNPALKNEIKQIQKSTQQQITKLTKRS